MICYAETTNQIRPAGGNSGVSPFCVTTSVGFSCWSNIMEDVKKCTFCKSSKPLSAFGKNNCRKNKYRCRCKVCRNKQNREYSHTENGRRFSNLRQKRYKPKNKLKKQARNAVTCAVTVGKLHRPSVLQCHYCLEQARQYHHWHGYEKENWLDVVPVCMPCHYEN